MHLRSTTMILAALFAASCGGSKGGARPAEPAPAPTPVEPAAPEPVATPAPVEPAPPAAPDPEQVKADLLAAETAAWDKAKPVFDQYCAGCHTTGGKKASKKKLEHFDMTSYPLGGEHAAMIGAEIREVLGQTGKQPTMPQSKPGAVQGDELAAVIAWADAWQAAEDGGAHPPAAAGEHHHH